MTAPLTLAQLVAILPYSRKKAPAFLPHLNTSMPKYGIDTPARVAAFIAQVGHESGSFVYMKELASGAAYDTGSLAKRLGNTPEADGDGQKYKGRGLIQITGRANYEACSHALFADLRLLTAPQLLELPEHAVASACWFWKTHGLNALADAGDFHRITKIINGGYNGLAERLALYGAARKELIA